MAERRILITGGSKGIGEAIVRAARQHGHQVVFTGRDEKRLAKVAKDTGAHGLHADIASAADNERTVAFAVEKMGGIDVLINNAAIGGDWGAIGELSVEDDVRRVFEVNVIGLVDLTNRVVPLMKQQGGGDIVNVASTSGMKGHARGTAYSGSKWALRGITQCWQAELRPHDIRVLCICPSEVQTGFDGGKKGSNPKKLFAEDIAGAILGCISMNHRGMIPEFAVWATNPF